MMVVAYSKVACNNTVMCLNNNNLAIIIIAHRDPAQNQDFIMPY